MLFFYDLNHFFVSRNNLKTIFGIISYLTLCLYSSSCSVLPLYKDFFNKVEEDESDKEEKSTTFKKNSKKRKYNKQIEKYKNYIITNEASDRLDTESQLKSSKRETATKKFFKPNPPKNKNNKNNTLKNSLVFSKKYQQKNSQK